MAQSYVGSDRVSVLANAATNFTVADGKHFRGFLVHVVGFDVGLAMNFQVSLDGTNFVTVETKNAAAGGIFFNIQLHGLAKGGVKITSAVSVAPGTIHVTMSDNPFNNFRMQG